MAANDEVELLAAHFAVEVHTLELDAAHDTVEVMDAHDNVKLVVAAYGPVAVHNYLCAAFHFIFQPNTAVSQK